MAWRLGNGKLRKDQTDHYGRLKNGGGGGGATADDFADSNTIIFSQDVATQKVRADIAVDVSNKIENSLQTPLSAPTATELVGIGTDKSQKRIKIGNGLSINEDNELSSNMYILEKNMPIVEETSEEIYASVVLTASEYANILNSGVAILKLHVLNSEILSDMTVTLSERFTTVDTGTFLIVYVFKTGGLTYTVNITEIEDSYVLLLTIYIEEGENNYVNRKTN